MTKFFSVTDSVTDSDRFFLSLISVIIWQFSSSDSSSDILIFPETVNSLKQFTESIFLFYSNLCFQFTKIIVHQFDFLENKNFLKSLLLLVLHIKFDL